MVITIFIGTGMALVCWKGFFTVTEGQAAVIERLGKFHRVVYGGFHLRIPFFDSFRVVGHVNRKESRDQFGPYRIDLREQIYDICKQHVITKDNVPLDVDTIIYYRVTEPEKTVYGITDLPKAIEQLAQTYIRNEFGRMDFDVSLGARIAINNNLKAGLEGATFKWGVVIERVEVQEIIAPPDLKETMEKQMVAERERRVKVLAAQAEKEAKILIAEGAKQQAILEAEAARTQEILRAEGEKQKMILRAEAEREEQILLAQGKREALVLESEGERMAKINQAEGESARILKRLNSEAEGLAQVSQALNAQGNNQTLLVLKSLEASVQIAEKLAGGQATKIILPQEVSGVMGTLLAVAEGVRAFQKEN